MRPLAASVAFIAIAMVVGIFRQVLFTSSASNSGDDSNIALSKLHTLTIAQQAQHRFNYNSLYQAFYKPQEQKLSPPPIPYNSFALKKAILNNEDVYTCDQKFAAIFEEKTFCEATTGICKWKTIITVYRLPFFKKEEQKTVEVQGRILKSGGISGQLECSKKFGLANKHHFELNFVVLQKSKTSKKGSAWTMNSLAIDEELGSSNNSTFSIKMTKWNLKNVEHYPKIYSYDQKCLTYVTEEQPWLVHFNCGKNWTSFNILEPKVQSILFSKINASHIQPPFSSTHFVSPLHLQVFKSTLKSYGKTESCTGSNCQKQQSKITKNFVTYVFQIVNSHFLLGSTVAQLTILINQKTSQKQAQGLVSYDILSNEINPEKKVNLDCSLHTKQYQFIRGLYSYQIGQQNEEHKVGSLSKHSLICICSYNYKQSLKIIQIEDLFEKFNISGLQVPGVLLVRHEDDLEQSKIENIVKKSTQPSNQEVNSQEEDSGWFDVFSFFQDDIGQESTHESINVDQDKQDQVEDQGDKKGKPKDKKDDKKRQKKVKKGSVSKLIKEIVANKFKNITTAFNALGHDTPFEASTKVLQFPMPFTLTSDSHFKVVSGDLNFPLVYIQTAKKYLLTYQPREQQDPKNKTKRIIYSYRYSQIGTTLKTPENYIRPQSNQTSKLLKRKEQNQLDRFLLEVIQQNSEILNQIKSVSVVDSKYEDNIWKYQQLKGMKKPFRKHVIVVWGWGIEVYEINWDKNGQKNQLSELEELLNSNEGGIEMLTLLPFVQLFATVYCLFQTLVSPR